MNRGMDPLESLARQLAEVRLAGWHGLPARLPASDGAEPAGTGWLGSEEVDAEMLLLDDPAPGAHARAWRRAGAVVLVDVTWRQAPGPGPLAELGAPDEVDDAVDGPIPLPGGEWLFPGRGLTALVGDGRAVRHLLGYVPTTADDYRRTLQPDLATRRRPASSSPGEGGR